MFHGEKPRVLRASPTTKRILAVSDIHGNYPLLKRLLEKMKYQPGKDSLVFVGDLLEKGPENLNTLQFVMELAKEEGVFVLRGNCDTSYSFEDLPGALRKWQERSLYCEMARCLGVPLPNQKEEVPAFLSRLEQAYPQEIFFMKSWHDILEIPQCYFAHAGLQSEKLEEQELGFVLSAPWFAQNNTHRFSKPLVVGHFPANNYRKGPIDYSPYYDEAHQVFAIDGGNMVNFGGQLNGVILDTATGEWQGE